MFRGTVDRAGTREGKKTSLRKTGKDKKQSSAQVQDEGPKFRTEPIPTLKESNKALSTFDSGANLVNRHLESDSARVIQRAIQSGVDGIVLVTNDFEKSDKSLSIAEANTGVVYSAVGIHPNNISAKKMSDKLFLQFIQQLRNHAVKPHVVAIYGGLDYERDYGLKYPQEKFLKSQIKLAAELGLPVILQDMGGGENMLEVLKDSRQDIIRAMIYVFQSSPKYLEKYIEMDFYISFNGLICEQSDKGDQVRDYLTKVPKDRIIILSDAPNVTPQTIADEYIRKQPNEPSNLIHIIQTAAKCLQMTPEELANLVKENSKRFYNLNQQESNTTSEEVTIATNTTTTTKTNTESKSQQTTNKKQSITTKNKKSKSKKDESEEEEEDIDSQDDDGEEEEEEEVEEEKENHQNQIINRLDKEELDNLYYSCKKCRTKLFKLGEIEQHEEKAKILDHNAIKGKKGKQQQQQTTSKKSSSTCKSLFIKPTEWVQKQTKQLPLITCPNTKCGCKLGSYNEMGGEKCSCSQLVVGCVRVPKSRVEVVLLGKDGELVDLSLLNLSDDDDSDDDLPTNKSKSKTKRGKKNQKKNNKSNFSNYRNKNAGVSLKNKSSKQSTSKNNDEEPSDGEERHDDDQEENETDTDSDYQEIEIIKPSKFIAISDDDDEDY